MAHTLRKVDKDFSFDEQRVELNELAQDVYNLKHQVDSFNLDDLVDVTASGATNSQIIKYNGTEWVLDTDIVSTSFTVINANPSGSVSSLGYNNTNGTFTFTPADLSLYRLNTATLNDIPGVTITNAVNTDVLQFDGSVWKNQPFAGVNDINDIGNVLITNPQNGQVIKYDNANNRWINATDAGGTTINSIDDIADVTTTNTQNNQLLKYNSSAGRWENWTHNFLTSFTETDPIFSASAAAGITATQINNWNTAHGWGNHAAQGYLLPVLTNLQTDEMLRWNGTNWINEPTSVHLHQFKSDWTEQDSAKPAFILNKPSLATVATTGSFTDLTDRTLTNLSDVSTVGIANGHIIKFNGTSWESTPDITTIEGLSNVVITNPTNGQVIKYNGTNWINDADVSGGGGGSGSVTVADTAPSGPSNGDLWFKSDEGQLKVYYDDGQGSPSSQWVDTSNNAGGGTGSGGSGASVTISDTPPTGSSVGDLWWKSNEGRLKIRYNDGDGTPSVYWVDAFPILDAPTYGYSISAEQGTGTSSKFRLTGTGDVAGIDDITFAGADGITVERTDANTLTFRQGAGGSGSGYSDNDAKDAAAAMIAGGTHQNITFTYDSTNRTLSATAQASGGGGGTTYDLTGSNNTSNQALLNLVPASGTTDTIEFAGSNGTDVAWDSANNKITINSTAPVKSDWNATTGLAEILNKPNIPSAYTLPTASATVLGGIKVGSNLTIDANTGVLSAVQGSYTLPIASTTVLGGVKVDGTSITIDGNGVITANAGSTSPSITDLTDQTGIITQNGGIGDLNISGYKGYVLYKITSSHEAWIRVFVDDASRQADDTRSEGTDPTPGGGVIAEVRTSGPNQSVLITPGVMGFNNDNPRTPNMYLSVVNRSNVTTAIDITLTALKIGE